MLTNSGYRKKLEAILTATNMDDGVADLLNELRIDREEVDSVVRRYAKMYPEKEDVFDFEDREPGDWEAKYNDLREKYTRRFFHPNGEEDTTALSDVSSPREISNELDDKDGKVEEELIKGIDDLFKEEE